MSIGPSGPRPGPPGPFGGQRQPDLPYFQEIEYPPYEKPGHLLKEVPYEPATSFQAQKIRTAEAFPSGGVWRFDLSSVVQTLTQETGFFDDDDFVRLFVWSSPKGYFDASFESVYRGDVDGTMLMFGPFRLGSFCPCTWEIPTFLEQQHFCLTFTSASLKPDKDEYHALARGQVNTSIERMPGYSETLTNQRTVLVQEKHGEDSGIHFSGQLTLLSLDRRFDAPTTKILAHIGADRYGIILNDAITATGMIELNAFGSGNWEALTTDNRPREAVPVPAYGSFKYGMVASSCPAKGKPIGDFIFLYSLNRMLPRVPDRQTTFPNLKLSVVEFKDYSRWNSSFKKFVRTELSLDGTVIQPWYNFESWPVAYMAKHSIRPYEFPADDDISAIRSRVEAAIDAEVQLWVDVDHRLLVVYGKDVRVDEVGIRGMLVTIPMKEEHLPFFAHLPKPISLL